MPIFARRQLNLMLNELSESIGLSKCSELLNLLESVNTIEALAAEAELSILWAVSKVADITVEPALPNSSRRPDAFSKNLFAPSNAVIEIRALSDDNFSGREAMDRTANIIVGFANQIRKGAGDHLFFEFSERSYWDRRYHRDRCVDPKFELNQENKKVLRNWICNCNWPDPDRIRIVDGKTDVIIVWHKATSRHFRVFCKMPPVAYHLEDNPVYKALRKKARQVSGASEDTLGCIFLVDTGCDLLRKLKPWVGTNEIGGEAIIKHALKKLGIDIVCVFSPYRAREIGYPFSTMISWKVTAFDKREPFPKDTYVRLEELAKKLPQPRFEGYQARDLHKRGAFQPQKRGWYLSTEILIQQGGTRMSIKLSSRLVLEYLTGRIDAASFKRHAFDNDANQFDAALAKGLTIQGVKFENGGQSEDDDYLVFDMELDWGATALALKKAKSKNDDD
jgi:hypothetical protein